MILLPDRIDNCPHTPEGYNGMILRAAFSSSQKLTEPPLIEARHERTELTSAEQAGDAL